MRGVATTLCLGILILAVPSGAQQAATADQITSAYGARVGVRNERADVPGVSQDLRTTRRLQTRIDSRVATRIERYADPSRTLWAYAATPDDGSRRPTVAVAPPTIAIPTPDEAPE